MPYFVKKKINGKKYLYIAWAKRIGSKSKVIRQLYVGNAQRVAEILQSPLPKFTSHSYGELALLLHIAELSGFAEIVDKRLRKTAGIGNYLFLPVINRLIAPRSKAGLKEWYDKTCLPLIWDNKLSLSSQNYWYYLNRLTDEHMETIWQGITKNIREKLQITDSTFLFDPTNFFTYIEDHDGNVLPRKGHNKQMRHDKNQLAVSLFIGEASQMPYDFNTYPGNTNDGKHFSSILPELGKKASIWNKEKITLVIDKGNNSKENLAALKDYYFVGSLSKVKTEVQDLLDAELKPCYVNANGNAIRSASAEMEIYGISCRAVVSFNEALRKKQLHSLDANIAKTMGKFETLKNRAFRSEGAATLAVVVILPRKNNPFDFVVKKEGNKFTVSITLDEDKVENYRKNAGKNVIFTNHLDWDDERIIRTYRSMHKIENQFKLLHGLLLIPMKPVFHWTDQKIKAHIFLCMVALLFAKTLEYACKGKIKGSFRQILDSAAAIRIALVHRDGQPKLVFEDLTLEQQELMEAFRLSRFAKN